MLDQASATSCRWLLAVALTVAGCAPAVDNPVSVNKTGTDASSASNAELPIVATAKPQRKELAQKTEQPARIEAFTTTPIHAKVSGFMEQRLVDIGDKVAGPIKNPSGAIVEPGQLLAVLAAPELDDERRQKEALIAQAQADVQQADAAVQVAQSKAAAAEADVAAGVASQQRAAALYRRWNSESQRLTSLAANQTVTRKLAEEAEQQLLAADATRKETEAQVVSMKAKLNESAVAIVKSQADRRSVEARLKVAQAECQRVTTMCEYLKIRAPFSGIVTVRNVDLGHLVQAAKSSDDQPLFVLVQSDRVRVFVDVPEMDSSLVELGRKAVIKVPALGARSFDGTVARTGWALQSGTRALKCEIDVANNEGILRPGMYANAEITVAQKSDILALPKTAILQRDGLTICLTVSTDGTVTSKPVKTGIRSPLEVEIVSGLDGTEDVIIANASAFKVGQRVAIAKPPAK